MSTTADVLLEIATVRDAPIASTGDAIDVLGFRLAGHEIERDTTAEDPALCGVLGRRDDRLDGDRDVRQTSAAMIRLALPLRGHWIDPTFVRRCGFCPEH